jgi:two-component system nitrogen regulation response regulator GlnG
VIEALRDTRGNQVQAAKLLGITRATLRKRIEKFGIKQELAVN